MREKIDRLLEDFRALDHQMAAVSSGDTAKLTELAKERKRLEPLVLAGQEFLRLADEVASLELLSQGDDASLAEMAHDELPAVRAKLESQTTTLNKLFRPPDPKANRDTIIEIRAGAGGDEAGLFAADLFRMYTRFAQSKGLAVSVFSSNSSGVGGFKEVIFGVSGANAYGWFRFEQGVHRVQRVPKTEAQGRIHTSTVTVAVLPEPTETEVKVEMKDLRIDTYRSSGAGGQHVNKTESAIRITHVPTGIVVACQEERSQGQNRLRAMSLLRAKLQEAEEEKNAQERSDLRRRQIGSGERSEKIRTYNFPQDRITDHRINFSMHGMDRLLDGGLEPLQEALADQEDRLRESEEKAP